VVMAALTIGIMFLLFSCMDFWVMGMTWRWFACAPTVYEVVRFAEILRNTGLQRIVFIQNVWHHFREGAAHLQVERERERCPRNCDRLWRCLWYQRRWGTQMCAARRMTIFTVPRWSI
jgi:hypothetical protein